MVRTSNTSLLNSEYPMETELLEILANEYINSADEWYMTRIQFSNMLNLENTHGKIVNGSKLYGLNINIVEDLGEGHVNPYIEKGIENTMKQNKWGSDEKESNSKSSKSKNSKEKAV